MEEVTARGTGVEIRRAGPGDADALSRVAFAAKGRWGYPDGWMERWREGLTISPEFVSQREVYAAFVEGEPVGFYALVGEGPKIELEHLWVLPEHMGLGLGRALFDHASAGPRPSTPKSWGSRRTRTRRGSTGAWARGAWARSSTRSTAGSACCRC